MILRILVAGVALGYAMALLSTAAATYALFKIVPPERLEQWVDRGVPRPLVLSQVLVAATMLWTLLGFGLGALYLLGDFEDDPSALGTPSITFAAVAAALAFLPLPIAVAIARRGAWLWISMSAVFAVLFGWVMPLLGG